MDLRYPHPVDVAVHRDGRGAHSKFFGATPEAIAVPDYNISEVFMTTNNRNTVRGLHFQQPGQPKIIQVISGAVVGNILCCNPELPEFGRVNHFFLQENSDKKIYVPGDWALGYRAVVDNSRVLYLAGAPFYGPGDVGIDPFDPELELDWNLLTGEDEPFTKETAILSERDKNLPSFADFKASLTNDGVTRV